MAKQVKTAISPTRNEDYPEWYQQVIKASDMAERSPVRGCMVIKPWGYALWENIVQAMDNLFKATGVRNAYFPLFIPLSFFEKEAEHVACRSAGGAFGRAPDIRDHYRRFIFQMGEQLSRFADTDQPVGQCCALGNADPDIFKDQRIFVAGGTHRTRNG
jgi:hypothetical protein